MEVTADAGVIVRDLANMLREKGLTFEYVTIISWWLAHFLLGIHSIEMLFFHICSQPFWQDQTIGGSLATATHGSSISYGSLAQQTKRLDVVLSNGTFITATPSDGYLFDALRTQVGRLGIIVRVTLDLYEDREVGVYWK